MKRCVVPFEASCVALKVANRIKIVAVKAPVWMVAGYFQVLALSRSLDAGIVFQVVGVAHRRLIKEFCRRIQKTEVHAARKNVPRSTQAPCASPKLFEFRPSANQRA